MSKTEKPLKVMTGKKLVGFRLDWVCEKGHKNAITTLEQAETIDCCFKCGKAYQLKVTIEECITNKTHPVSLKLQYYKNGVPVYNVI
jgi:hypothetical protein